MCVAPTWPLGAHTEPMRAHAELTLEVIAAGVGELIEKLSLEDVVLVGNDTGGVIAQIVATTAPARLGALVLTSCDAFEHFPPPILRPFIAAARFAPTFRAALQPLRTRLGRQRAYGALAHADIDELATEWLQPALTDSKVREDLRRLTASLDQRTTVEAGRRLSLFNRPALVAWSGDDEFFPARRRPTTRGDPRQRPARGHRPCEDVLDDRPARRARRPDRGVCSRRREPTSRLGGTRNS